MVEKYMKMVSVLQRDAENFMKKADDLSIDEKKLRAIEKASENENDFRILGIAIAILVIGTFVGINLWLFQ